MDLNSKSAVSGFINGSISISGVPTNADIVEARLYWETIWTTRGQLDGMKFNDEKLTDIDPATGVNKVTGVIETEVTSLNDTTAACLASNQRGLQLHVSSFSADVLHLLPGRLDTTGAWTGMRYANGSHTVKLADRGSGDGAPISAGATLMIVYRDPAEPLRKIIVYDGAYAQSQGTTTTQTIRGFLQSTGSAARVTAIGGSNQGNATDRFRFYNERGSTVTLFTDGFKSLSTSDRGWSNPTFDISAATVGAANAMPGLDTAATAPYGEEVKLTFDHTKTTPYECQTFHAFLFSTAVKDVDGDGLPDRLEDATTELRTPPTPAHPNGDPLPRLNLMGAKSVNPDLSPHKDLFIEINAAYTTGPKTYGSATAPFNSLAVPDPLNPPPASETWCTPQGFNHDVLCSVNVPLHTHIPDPDGLKMVGKVYADNGITPHFDVGNTAAYLGANDCGGPTPHAVCPYLVPTAVNSIPLARGGETILEQACASDDPDTPCQFPDYPGTIGWKYSYELVRDAPVGDTGQELTTPAELQAWMDGTGVSTTYRHRFDIERRELFHYLLYAHAVGNPRSLPCVEDGFPAPYDASGATCTRAGASANPSFRSIDYHVPSSSSGIADQPGSNAFVTIGLWDKLLGTGTAFLQASTTLHELGHNLGLSHGGPLPIPGDANANPPTATVMETNCKPNYQSSMSYLFQVHGMIDANFEQQIGYSGVALNTIN